MLKFLGFLTLEPMVKLLSTEVIPSIPGVDLEVFTCYCTDSNILLRSINVVKLSYLD